MSITLRETKGSPLTYSEGDNNFRELDTRTGQGWRDNIIQMTTRGGITEPPFKLFKGNIWSLAFSQNDLQEVFGNFHIDHDYALGTALYPHIHWSTQSNQVGTVRWGFEICKAKGHQQEAFGTCSTVYIEQITTGTSYMHYVAEVSDLDALSPVGVEPDTILMCRVFRDATHPNDTLDAEVFGITLDMHYQVNRISTPNKRPNFYS